MNFIFHFHLSVFSPNAGKYGPEKLRIRTLFTQCNCLYTILAIALTIFTKTDAKKLKSCILLNSDVMFTLDATKTSYN